ncbi:MAG: aryl-sulfate sulfotransferase, partial [Flavobacteriales bacterium]|nr:aryl-sulfate sulfotransferase [Flavobacteriales bacterium]
MNKILFIILAIIQISITSQDFNGFALYNSQNQNTAYLIDKDGSIAKTWNCNVACNYTVLLKENGNIVRGGKYASNQLNGAAIGGVVQEIDPSGNVVWEFIYSNSNHCSHHDICLVGDNVMLIAWEVKTVSELTQAGYNGATTSKWPTHFVEIAQNGSGGQIVWEWHIWDHLIQDHDSSKDNFGVISNHPELIDINMISATGGGPPGMNSGDWFHINGIDYNADLDQIAFSSRHASEVYIIDHSTTTSEAATHSGGNSGKGGDILYRWGNPSNYGLSGNQIIPNAVHDIRWIEDDGRPYGGYLQIFNNKGINNTQSTVDVFLAPLDSTNGNNYFRTSGQAFGPASYDSRYVCQYSAPGQSAA